MVFKMRLSNKDEKLFHKETINFATFGKGTYSANCNITLQFGKMNVLGGRFSSLADGILFSMGGNHPIKSVTSSPIDVEYIVKGIFGEIRPNLCPIPNVRINHRQIIFGHDVWIGNGVTIMGGVKIGNGAVIGANAVVAKEIPPYAIAVGNPARVIKYRFDVETIKKFLAVKWWNWSLEKIADNFPLMNDVEKFLATHYSPELEDFPEDDFSRQLKNAVGRGWQLYHFIPDFQSKDPLWFKVVQNFCQSNFKTSLLVIWLDKDTSEEDIKSLAEVVDSNQNIFTFRHDKNFSPRTLRQGTHFITTREMSTLEVLDYLWDTDVKIISALDDDIFNE